MLNLQRQFAWYLRAQWALAAAIALIVGGFYFFAYRPQTRRLAELQGVRSRHERDLNAGLTQTSILPAVRMDVERLKVQLDKYKTLPRQQELPQFIKDVAQLGQQASLKKFDLKPGVPTRASEFSEQPVQLNFEGDFVNVFSFLRHTEELERLTRVRGMTIKGRDKLGQVKVHLSMNIYVQAD
jgi:Tfp pilus assembly protein PilO